MQRSVLKPVQQPLSFWQKISGGVLSGVWTRPENPPITPEKLGFYEAALAGKAPEAGRVKIARALIWADIRTRQYRPSCLPWYPFVADTFPDDERCAFYLAALSHHGVLKTDASDTERNFGRLMRPVWRDSSYWSKLDLPRGDILRRITQICTESDDVRVTPERLPIFEAAFESGAAQGDERVMVARCLSVAYRSTERIDETAEIVYRFVFLNAPEDTDNNRYLAQLFLTRGKTTPDSCAVYQRMVEQAEDEFDPEQVEFWSVHLARNLLALDRVDAETLPILRRALKTAPDDRLLEAAVAYAAARFPDVGLDDDLLKRLETAVAFEAEFVPHFQVRRWQWSLVPRALALAWGEMGRKDPLASFIYARAVELCPEERPLWGYYGGALAETGDLSPRAMEVYEKALGFRRATQSVEVALGRAYLHHRVHETAVDRKKVLALWENLYRSGVTDATLRRAMAAIYLREDRLGDLGIAVLSQLSGEDPGSGQLRLRLAREYRLRGEFDTALVWYRDAIRLMPQDFDALLECGLLLKDQYADFPAALSLLEKSVALPEGISHFGGHFALGEIHLALGRREDAKRTFQTIVGKIDADHTQTLLYLARLNLRYEDEGAAIAERLYTQAVENAPENAETYRLMADLYRERGDTEAELQALEKYLTIGEPDAERFRQLADLYIRIGEFSRAESALRQVVALGGADRETYTLLGEVVTQARRKTAA